jgi:RsiW-degrading membrane proteinase PrsW (M82 family)
MTGPRRRLGDVLLVIGLVVGFGLCAAALLLLLGRQYGAVVPLVSAGAAALPVPVLVMCLRWLDRYQPEPVKYLLFAFLWGALVATVGSVVLGIAGRYAFGALVPPSVSAIWIAPPTEEFGKALPVLLLYAFRRREFGGIVDGISYAAMAGIGFAFTENILYFSQAYTAGLDSGGTARGVVRLLVLFVLRGVLSPFAHPLFTACTGIGLGIAVHARARWVRVGAPLLGFAVAVSLHHTWNTVASTGSASRALQGYVFVMVPALAVVVAIAVVVRTAEARTVRRVLPAYVDSGWLSADEVAWLADSARRDRARRWARAVAGSKGARAMAGYQFDATRLALLRDRARRRAVDETFPDRERALLTSLSGRREFLRHYSPSGPFPPSGGG